MAMSQGLEKKKLDQEDWGFSSSSSPISARRRDGGDRFVQPNNLCSRYFSSGLKSEFLRTPECRRPGRQRRCRLYKEKKMFVPNGCPSKKLLWEHKIQEIMKQIGAWLHPSNFGTQNLEAVHDKKR
ncbi:defective in germ line development protein 3 [Striga asiatica]|uniref:Defective in germ line development protein 3 n=1 Tax=Striga asiatica TaxID=4170 RepID=A0A5A7P8Y9_STRAF|nr:defective in germ line development protein 3 [Striga asiatica]